MPSTIAPLWPPADVRAVAPALEKYINERVDADLWARPGLSPRNRSIVTLAVLIARNQVPALTHTIARALDHGVEAREISEIVTHLACYCGLTTAIAATGPVHEVFAQRGIGIDQLPKASPALLPLDASAEAERAARIGTQFGELAPGLVQYTADVLFLDLWLRPDLAPRDRSLVTVSALIASGQVNQIPYHLNRAMDAGLTQTEAVETITHLAFYAGWPYAFSALPIAREVFEKRPR